MNNTLITQDRLDELVRLCKETPDWGEGIELGVYKGGSLKFLAEAFPDRHFTGFDTFEGLPEDQWNDLEIHLPGEFNDTSLQSVSAFINLKNVTLEKGLFPDSAFFFTQFKNSNGRGIPVSFVHVDFDFYEGIKAAIDFFYPRLVAGGIMVFDDYEWPNCPGVKRALDESGIPYQPTNAKYQAYLIKQ